MCMSSDCQHFAELPVSHQIYTGLRPPRCIYCANDRQVYLQEKEYRILFTGIIKPLASIRKTIPRDRFKDKAKELESTQKKIRDRAMVPGVVNNPSLRSQ
jgi:hypothetical protein